jgi:hypothetical protein
MYHKKHEQKLKLNNQNVPQKARKKTQNQKRGERKIILKL